MQAQHKRTTMCTEIHTNKYIEDLNQQKVAIEFPRSRGLEPSTSEYIEL